MRRMVSHAQCHCQMDVEAAAVNRLLNGTRLHRAARQVSSGIDDLERRYCHVLLLRGDGAHDGRRCLEE